MKLLKLYNHPCYLRFQHNNLFIHTPAQNGLSTYNFSVGRLADYQKKKKKKKTYMAGFESGYLLQQKLRDTKIQSVHCLVKGNGAHVRGLFDGLTRHKHVALTAFTQYSPVAHNGTKACRHRRL